MKPVRMLKKLAAAAAAGLLALGLVAGTASAASAGPETSPDSSGEIAYVETGDSSGEIADAGDSSGETGFTTTSSSGEIA